MKVFVNYKTSTDLLPEYYSAFGKIGNLVLQPLAKDVRFKNLSNSRLIVSSVPDKNQTELTRVDRKPDVNGAHNVFVWQNAPTLIGAIKGKANSTAKDSARNADADIVASIGKATLECVYLANSLKAYTVTNGNKKPTPEFIKDLKVLGFGGNQTKVYAMQGVKAIAQTLKAEIKIIKALKVAPYIAPSDNGQAKKARLFCVEGCDLNELLTQKFKLDDIPNVQRVLTCKVHSGTLATQQQTDKAKVEAVKTAESILN